MAAVFVNYRVKDQPGYATLVHRELAKHFGPGQVFLASRSIPLGDNFVDTVFDTLKRCAVLVAVIGPQWVRHLGDPRVDWVQRELRVAFARGIRVIPILVDDATIPNSEELPEGIAALAHCQHLRLGHYTVDNDLARLVDELRHSVTVPVEPATGETSRFRVGGSPCGLAVASGTIRGIRSADLWVNSENTDMRMARYTDFSVSGIIRYWGARRDASGRVVDDLVADELEARIGRQRPVAPGTVVVTGAGELTATHNVRHVIHVAAVHGEPGAGYRQVRDIAGCVGNVLLEAEALTNGLPLRSVLVPLLGTGVAGADITATAKAVVHAAVDHLREHRDTGLRWIQFLGYKQDERDVLEDIIRGLDTTKEQRPSEHLVS